MRQCRWPRFLARAAVAMTLGFAVTAMLAAPGHAGGKKRKWDPSASPEVIFQPPTPPPAGSCLNNGVIVDSSCCSGGQAVGGTPADGCPSLDPSAKTTTDTIQEFVQAGNIGQTSLATASAFNGQGSAVGNMANPGGSGASGGGSPPLAGATGVLKNISATGGSTAGSAQSAGSFTGNGGASSGGGSGSGASPGGGSGSAGDSAGYSGGGTGSGQKIAGLGAVSDALAQASKSASEIVGNSNTTASYGGNGSAGGAFGSSDGDPGENSANLDPNAPKDGEQLGRRGPASDVSGTADPGDYFGRLKKDDSLFKVVERRYQSKAGQWAKAAATGLSEEARRYLK